MHSSSLFYMIRILFEITEDDTDSGFETKGMQDSRSSGISSAPSYNASMSSLLSTSTEKSSSSEDQSKKKGIPLAISAQVCSNSYFYISYAMLFV